MEFALLHDHELVIYCPACKISVLDYQQAITNSLHYCTVCKKSFAKLSRNIVANPPAILSPIFDGIAFSIDPFVAHSILKQCNYTTNTKFSRGD